MAQQAITAPERAALAVGLGVSWDDDLVAGRRTVAHAMAPSPVFATRAVHDDSVPTARRTPPPRRLFPRSLEGGAVPDLLTLPRRTGNTGRFYPAASGRVWSCCPTAVMSEPTRPGFPRSPRRRRQWLRQPLREEARRSLKQQQKRRRRLRRRLAPPQEPCLAPGHAACS
jgi:hypothetical protein